MKVARNYFMFHATYILWYSHYASKGNIYLPWGCKACECNWFCLQINYKYFNSAIIASEPFYNGTIIIDDRNFREWENFADKVLQFCQITKNVKFNPHKIFPLYGIYYGIVIMPARAISIHHEGAKHLNVTGSAFQWLSSWVIWTSSNGSNFTQSKLHYW